MKSFDVIFKDRTMTIFAPDEDMACEWAAKQPAQWGTPDLDFKVEEHMEPEE